MTVLILIFAVTFKKRHPVVQRSAMLPWKSKLCGEKQNNAITSTLMCWVDTLVEYEINSITECLVTYIAQIRSSSGMFKNVCF